MRLAQEEVLNNEIESLCHNLYFRVSLREVMVQKDDKCIFILAFPLFTGLFIMMMSSLQS